SQLRDILQRRHPNVQIIVENNGMMGGSSTATIDRLEPSLQSFQPHLVISMMGLKDEIDQAGGRGGFLSQSRFRVFQLFRWLTLSVNRHQEQLPADAESISDLPDSARVRMAQQKKNIAETRLLDEPDPEVSDKLELAIFLWFIQRHERAVDLLERTIEEHGFGYNVLAQVLVTNDEPQAAVDLLRNAIETHPEEGMYRITLIDLLTTFGLYSEASEALVATFEHMPTFHRSELISQHVCLSYAKLALAMGDPTMALAAVKKCKETEGTSDFDVQGFPNVTLNSDLYAGRAFAELSQYDKAEKVFLRALKKRPRRMDIMWALARMYREYGKFEDEAKARRTLMETKPRVGAYFELAKLLKLSGREAQVPDLFEEMAERFPSLERSHLTLYDLCQEARADLLLMPYPPFGPEAIQ
ncbi:MAG: tetratricopeptide repeat protein, partial [Myxococcota bacterium]|nr:tetratricopeptide repeat protein [Myxococcota bacterium]